MRAPVLAPLLGALASLASLASSARAQQVPDLGPYLIEERSAEVTLARSAAPRAVSDSATVLVLTRTGFVEAVRGSNGFTCLVVRSFSGDVDDPGVVKDPGFWNPRVRAPHCFNPPAVRTVLPAMLTHAKWVLSGTRPEDAAARTRRAYATREFAPPAPGAMAYMLSPQQHIVDANPHWLPHLMFYFDRAFRAATWGAGAGGAPVIDASAGDPDFPVLTLLVPVRRWSDGTMAAPAASH